MYEGVMLSSVASAMEQRKEKTRARSMYSTSRKASPLMEVLVVIVSTVWEIELGISIKSREEPGCSSRY